MGKFALLNTPAKASTLALSPKFLPLYTKEFAFVAVVCNVLGNVNAVLDTVITFADSVTLVAPEPTIFLNFNCVPSLAENTPTPDAPTFPAPTIGVNMETTLLR